MIGRDLRELYPLTQHSPGQAILKVENLSTSSIHDISFSLHSGEILGIGGLVGSGYEDVADALFGELPMRAGTVDVGGHVRTSMTARAALLSGMTLVGGDRARQGLNMKASVADNIVLPIVDRLSRFGFITAGRVMSFVRDQLNRLRIRARSPYQPVRELSGGNQQKVVLGRALASRPRVLVLVEPTRGVDVGARAEIYQQIDQLAREQTGVLLMTSDFDELQALSDRLLVFYRGRLAGELDHERATRELITSLATGAGGDDGN
jgi:ABC-type sugar transport system ATPase subunit